MATGKCGATFSAEPGPETKMQNSGEPHFRPHLEMRVLPPLACWQGERGAGWGGRITAWGPLTSGAPPARKQAQSVQRSPSDGPFYSGDEPGEVQVLGKLMSCIYQALTTCQVLRHEPASPSHLPTTTTFSSRLELPEEKGTIPLSQPGSAEEQKPSPDGMRVYQERGLREFKGSCCHTDP